MANDRVSRGEAQAVLNAFPSAGRIIRRKQTVIRGAPADPGFKASIRPFPGTVFDGRHYCAEDWHVIVVAEIDGGDRSYSRQDADSFLGQVTVSFRLDSNPLLSDRSSIRRFGDPGSFVPGWQEAYFFQQGTLMEPSSLTVGKHTVSYTETSPSGVYTEGIDFFIDPAGQGACV
jgi:hypothetical protein